MHDVHAEADYLQLVLHNDDRTPQDFVLDLLGTVFSQSAADAIEVTAVIERQGKAVCGPYPRAVAEALLQTARRRIQASGHSLLVTTEAGDDITQAVDSAGNFVPNSANAAGTVVKNIWDPVGEHVTAVYQKG